MAGQPVKSWGVPFLLEIGEITHKTDPIEKQMDVIAGYLNKRIMESGAVYTGETPLIRINDKKNPRWEGSFEIRIKEKISFIMKHIKLYYKMTVISFP